MIGMVSKFFFGNKPQALQGKKDVTIQLIPARNHPAAPQVAVS
ncbi:hypothetical protein [Desulfurivibrio dismutans]|nr:hypothetical protein [Desulfurivibrio alkaliphilus]MDF1614796.1 hypothetical protein [Desulfurivibrio alkaliphilus]